MFFLSVCIVYTAQARLVEYGRNGTTANYTENQQNTENFEKLNPFINQKHLLPQQSKNSIAFIQHISSVITQY